MNIIGIYKCNKYSVKIDFVLHDKHFNGYSRKLMFTFCFHT